MHQLKETVVDPMLNSLQAMRINKPHIKIGKSRKNRKQLQREYKLEKIKRENPDSIVIPGEPKKRKLYQMRDESVEVVSLDGSQFDEVCYESLCQRMRVRITLRS